MATKTDLLRLDVDMRKYPQKKQHFVLLTQRKLGAYVDVRPSKTALQVEEHFRATVETMLDPFLGIGNSAVAAQRCGVKKFIGFEIDENYLAETKRRLEL